MTLQTSGQISLSQVNTELGRGATTQLSMGSTIARTLAGVASGAISLSNFYGKSNLVEQIYSAPGNFLFTVPAGVTQLRATVVAAGGGGGVGVSQFGAGGGGASGAAVRAIRTVTPGQIFNIIVGYGAGSNGASGDPGGTSAVATETGLQEIQTSGGNGGTGAGNFYGGAGGTGNGYFVGSGWTLIEGRVGTAGETGLGGTRSGAGANFSLFYGISGTGGPTTTSNNSSIASLSATGWGAGGAGSFNRIFPTAYWGGKGGDGYVRLEWNF